MQERLPEHVEDVLTQCQIIDTTTSIRAYDIFHSTHFKKGDLMLERTHHEQGGRRIGIKEDEEYFKFITLVGILCVQFGFEFQEGYMRHYARAKGMKPPTSALHKLALASFVGYMNEQTYDNKQKVAEAAGKGTDAYYGAQGVLYESQKGVVRLQTLARSLIRAQDRFDDRVDDTDPTSAPRKICLPFPELNQVAAGLKFTANHAEIITPVEFRRRVYPHVEAAFGEFFDTEAVFITGPSYRPLSPYYSLA